MNYELWWWRWNYIEEKIFITAIKMHRKTVNKRKNIYNVIGNSWILFTMYKRRSMKIWVHFYGCLLSIACSVQDNKKICKISLLALGVGGVSRILTFPLFSTCFKFFWKSIAMCRMQSMECIGPRIYYRIWHYREAAQKIFWFDRWGGRVEWGGGHGLWPISIVNSDLIHLLVRLLLGLCLVSQVYSLCSSFSFKISPNVLCKLFNLYFFPL